MRRIATWCLVLSLLFPVVACGGQVTCYVTADNHYGLYVGGPAGENLRFYGRNEYGGEGNPGADNWSIAETLLVDVAADEFIYIAAWNISGGAAGLLGEFVLPSSYHFVTDGSWETSSTSITGLGDYSELPSVGSIANQIQSISGQGSWVSAFANQQNSVSWFGIGLVPNVISTAYWIWFADYTSPHGYLYIFRSDLGGEVTATSSTNWGDVKSLFR